LGQQIGKSIKKIYRNEVYVELTPLAIIYRVIRQLVETYFGNQDQGAI